MSDLNRVILTGRLTRDAEVRNTPSGSSLCEFGLASNRVYKSGEEKKEETLFVDVTLWGNGAAKLAQYLLKGKRVSVEGRLTLNQWEVDGQKRSKIMVTGDSVNFLGGEGPKTTATESAPSNMMDEEVPF